MPTSITNAMIKSARGRLSQLSAIHATAAPTSKIQPVKARISAIAEKSATETALEAASCASSLASSTISLPAPRALEKNERVFQVFACRAKSKFGATQ